MCRLHTAPESQEATPRFLPVALPSNIPPEPPISIPLIYPKSPGPTSYYVVGFEHSIRPSATPMSQLILPKAATCGSLGVPVIMGRAKYVSPTRPSMLTSYGEYGQTDKTWKTETRFLGKKRDGRKSFLVLVISRFVSGFGFAPALPLGPTRPCIGTKRQARSDENRRSFHTCIP